MTKIAFIVNANWRESTSGVGTFVRMVIPRWLQDFDCEVVELSAPGAVTSNEVTRSQTASKFKAVRFLSLRLTLGYMRQLWRDMRFVWSVRARLRGRLILVNHFGCETLPIAVRFVCPLHRIVAVSHTHAGQTADACHPACRLVERACAWSVSHTVFNSDANRQTWKDKLGVRLRRSTVIHYGLPEPKITVPSDYPVRLSGTVDFVCVSRFVGWKGHRQLLDAWRWAVERASLPIRLILVGDGPTYGEMQAYAREIGVADSVLFLGAKSGGADYFAGGDVGVQMSIEPEAFGFVLLEAMSRTTPVIASRLGGIPEVVEEGKTGLLVDPFDTDIVSEAILKFAHDPALRVCMGETGLKRYVERFSVERMLGDWGKFLQGDGE